MKVVISGGGTGGHIYPALAIAEQLRGEGAEILYIGCADSAESRLAASRGLAFLPVEAAALHRRSWRLFRELAINARGLKQAKALLRDFQPHIVIGSGGYASAPVVKAAQSLNIPTLLHEQNAFPGLANRYLARRADALCLTFAAAGPHLPHPERQHLTGLPIREAILNTSREQAREFFRLPADDQTPTLLITGGSTGAASINKAAEAAWPALLQQGWRIIHICGRDNYFKLHQRCPEQPRLLLYPYLDEMQYALALADLAIARAGASFLAEAAALALPTVLVPYPYAANDHQRSNAQSFAAADAAVLIEDDQLSGALLAKTAAELLANQPRLQRMSEQARSLAIKDAAQRIAAVVGQLVKQ